MITLDRLEQKIDTFAINQVQVCKALDALAESQGKLLARLDAMDAGLHETAMRNHAQMLDGLQVLGKRMDLAFDILGSALSKRPRKKARRR